MDERHFYRTKWTHMEQIVELIITNILPCSESELIDISNDILVLRGLVELEILDEEDEVEYPAYQLVVEKLFHYIYCHRSKHNDITIFMKRLWNSLMEVVLKKDLSLTFLKYDSLITMYTNPIIVEPDHVPIQIEVKPVIIKKHKHRNTNKEKYQINI